MEKAVGRDDLAGSSKSQTLNESWTSMGAMPSAATVRVAV